MLPFQPESMESAKARFRVIFAAHRVVMESSPPVVHPALDRNHVFDFEDGVRMIATVEKFDDGQKLLHVSFSWYAGAGHKYTLAALSLRNAELVRAFCPPSDWLMYGIAVHLDGQKTAVLVPRGKWPEAT